MRLLTTLLWTLLAVLQYQLWFSQHGVRQLFLTHQQIKAQQYANKQTSTRNQKLAAQIISLQNNTSANVEAHAREDLGMIRQGETFYFMPGEK